MNVAKPGLARFLILLLGLTISGWSAANDAPPAGTPEPSAKTLLLVARPGLNEPFAGAVVAVGTLGGNRHLGVIMNRPIGVTLDQLIPQKKQESVLAPRREVNLGGPEMLNVLFAVVRSDSRPDASGIALSKDLFLVGEAVTVDSLIVRDAPEARYFVGLTMWDEGELMTEVSQGMWTLVSIDTNELLNDPAPSSIWERLRIESAHAPLTARFHRWVDPGQI